MGVWGRLRNGYAGGCPLSLIIFFGFTTATNGSWLWPICVRDRQIVARLLLPLRVRGIICFSD